MTLKPFRKVIGLIMVADGLMAVVSPVRYTRKLQIGVPLVDDILDYFAEDPELTQKLSFGEMAIGLLLAVG